MSSNIPPISPRGPTGSISSITGFISSFGFTGPDDFRESVIVNSTFTETVYFSSATEVSKQGTDISGNNVTETTFVTNDQEGDVVINEDLRQTIVQYYDDDTDTNSPRRAVMNQIKGYAEEIQCENFKGKGTIDDYQELFYAASKIANETQQMTLNVDISGFNEFASAADDLSKLFAGFTLKLQNVSMINDLSFLEAIANALAKIVNLSKVFGKFKQTVFATTRVEVPKSSHDTAVLVSSVMKELNCAMGYIHYFVDSSGPAPSGSELSSDEQALISNAVTSIENWSTLCSQDVSVSMSSSADIQFIKSVSQNLHDKSQFLKNSTSTLKGKFFAYNLF